MHEVQYLRNDQWHVGQKIRDVVFQESFVILPCKPVTVRYHYCHNVVNEGNHLQELQTSVYRSEVLGSLNSETMHFWTYIDINYFYYLCRRNSFLKLCHIFL
jgi:hypothetical protein